MLETQLAKDHEDMRAQVEGLGKLVKITKASHEERSNDLREDYIKLWNDTEELKQLIFTLRMKMDKIEDTMGMNDL